MPFKDLWKKISQSDSVRPTRIVINPENIDKKDKMQESFEKHQQYFIVRVNEMFLTYKRKWLSEYDPMVFVVSEFLYNGAKHAVPFVVGPTLLEGKMENLPEGMVFQDTTVAGLHPYSGGSFGVSIVLARLKQKDYLRKILKLIEKTSATYTSAFASVVSQYIKVAEIVLDGINDLMDSDEVEPLMGHRKEFFPEAGDDFKPGFFALINAPENTLEKNKYFIKENRLFFGDTMESAKPYREEDYVLYSIMGSQLRSDFETLPFFQLWRDLMGYIKNIQEIGQTEESIINSKMFALQDNVRISPDLTRNQIPILIAMFRKDLEEIKNERKTISGREFRSVEKDEWETKMDAMALDILQLQ